MSARPSTSSATLGAHVAPTVPPAIHALANPPPALIDAQLPAYLLPEVLGLLRESTTHVLRKKRKEEDELREDGLLPPPQDRGKGKGKASEEDEVRAEVEKKVERMGLMVGGYVAEKWVF